MKYCEKSIRDVCDSNKKILDVIYKKMIESRPKENVIYHPYTVTKLVPDKNLIGVDFKDYFSEFQDGDFAFLAYGYDSQEDCEMIYNLFRHSDYELYFNGKKCETRPYSNGTMDSDVFFNKGENTVIIKVIAKDGEMKATPKLLIPELHSGGYAGIPIRQYIPLDGMKKQKGLCFSKLYKKGDSVEPKMDKIEWIYPVIPEQSNVKRFDFKQLREKGKAAYAYTHFEGKIKLNHASPLKVFANGKEIYSELGGVIELEFKETTQLLFKSVEKGNDWGFTATSDGKHSLPGIVTDDFDDLHWLWVGPFGRMEDFLDHPYPPEINITFDDPYPTIYGSRVYWNFYRKDTVMVQSLDTKSFGRWFYACMVGVNALSCLADKLEISELYDYFMKCMDIICNHREYALYEKDKYVWACIHHHSAVLDHLDFIGTFGMNIAEYYLMSGSKDARSMLYVLAEKLENNIPRFPDGVFNRINTMWADDLYMSLPFLVRLGIITGEEKYFDEVLTQINGYYERMFMKDQNIFSHIYFVEEKTANRIPWGRGNGWILLALSEVLLLMPESYNGRERILEIFKEFASGVLNCRDKKEGIWHQVINNNDSYIESSGSAMFITALARGVRCGWIEDCTKDILEAWGALSEKCIDSEGNVYGICMGSRCSMEEKYYMDLATVTNDDHGVGVVISAGIEVMNLLGE